MPTPLRGPPRRGPRARPCPASRAYTPAPRAARRRPGARRRAPSIPAAGGPGSPAGRLPGPGLPPARLPHPGSPTHPGPASPGPAQPLSPLEQQPHGEDPRGQREHRQHVPGARVAVAVGRALQVGPAHVLRQPEALAPQPAPQEAQGSRRRRRHLTPARRPPPPQPPRQPRPTEPAGKQPRGGARPTATLFRPRVLPAAQPASPAGLASSPPISPSRPLPRRRRRRSPGALRWGLASARPRPPVLATPPHLQPRPGSLRQV